jgi:hypothetical protein
MDAGSRFTCIRLPDRLHGCWTIDTASNGIMDIIVKKGCVGRRAARGQSCFCGWHDSALSHSTLLNCITLTSAIGYSSTPAQQIGDIGVAISDMCRLHNYEPYNCSSRSASCRQSACKLLPRHEQTKSIGTLVTYGVAQTVVCLFDS